MPDPEGIKEIVQLVIFKDLPRTMKMHSKQPESSSRLQEVSLVDEPYRDQKTEGSLRKAVACSRLGVKKGIRSPGESLAQRKRRASSVCQG